MIGAALTAMLLAPQPSYCERIKDPEALYDEIDRHDDWAFERKQANMRELDTRIARCNAIDQFRAAHPRR